MTAPGCMWVLGGTHPDGAISSHEVAPLKGAYHEVPHANQAMQRRTTPANTVNEYPTIRHGYIPLKWPTSDE